MIFIYAGLLSSLTGIFPPEYFYSRLGIKKFIGQCCSMSNKTLKATTFDVIILGVYQIKVKWGIKCYIYIEHNRSKAFSHSSKWKVIMSSAFINVMHTKGWLIRSFVLGLTVHSNT